MATPAPQPPAGPHRSGFTIIELLAVIGVMAVLMGIAYAGIFASQRKQGLIAGTSLVTSMVRQARATALSTGTAVQLRLDAQDGTISGVTQQPVLHVDFEDVAFDFDGDGTLDDRDSYAVPGVAGYGWVVGYPGIDRPDGVPSGSSTPTIDTYQRAFSTIADAPLMREAGDGFLVECWIKPPPVADAVGGLTFSDALGPFLPVLRIGVDDGNRDAGNAAYIGINLRPVMFEIQQAYDQSGAASTTAQEWRWTVEGWIMNGSTAVVVDDAQPRDIYHPTAATVKEEAIPEVGGEWLRIGLSSDGEQLRLLRNGIEFGEVAISGIAAPPAVITAQPQHSSIAVFFGRDGGLTDPDYGGIIDEIRVLRLGTDRPVRLPGGVTFASGSPDRITIGGGSSGTAALSGGTTTIVLESTTDTHPDGSYRSAEIAVTGTGQAIVAYPQPSP